jgi:para-nitrobenzyl esterase
LRPHDINHYFGEEPTGEDCLYLNLWAPAEASRDSHLPVIVFIYGGGGTIGSSAMALYDGENVARHGAVLVTFNYRVGALGFMAHPQLTQEQGGHSGNYGYLDQVAALRWVQDNVAAFGGDPARVLLAGQSFGAGSVAAHMFSPLSKGLFRAATMWSACNFTTSGPDLKTAEQTGLELQKRLGVSSLEQMRSVPADRILAAQAESQAGVSVSGLRTPPLIDGYFLTASKDVLLKSHRFNDLPILVSSNSDDLDASASPLTHAQSIRELEVIAERLYGPDSRSFLKLYPVKTDADVHESVHIMARENGMLESSRVCARDLAQVGASHAYIGLFARKHPYVPGVRIADQNTETIGAYHSGDVPYWLNTFGAFNIFRQTRNWTPEDQKLSEVMLGSLIALARSGSPDVPQWKWPAWSAKDEKYTLLGDRIQSASLQAARMDWLAAHTPLTTQRAAERSGARD